MICGQLIKLRYRANPKLTNFQDPSGCHLFEIGNRLYQGRGGDEDDLIRRKLWRKLKG